MEYPESLNDVDRDEIRDLYDGAISHQRVLANELWRGQKYYTTLNTAIFGGAIALGRLEFVGGIVDIRFLPLFFLGAITSIMGYKTIRRLRRYYLQAAVKKTAIELILGYRTNFSVQDTFKTDLSISWIMEPHGPHGVGDQHEYEQIEDIINNEDGWIRENIRRRGSVTYWFMNLQLVFFILNTLLSASIILYSP